MSTPLTGCITKQVLIVGAANRAGQLKTCIPLREVGSLGTYLVGKIDRFGSICKDRLAIHVGTPTVLTLPSRVVLTYRNIGRMYSTTAVRTTSTWCTSWCHLRIETRCSCRGLKRLSDFLQRYQEWCSRFKLSLLLEPQCTLT